MKVVEPTEETRKRTRNFGMVVIPVALALICMGVGYWFYIQSRELHFTERYLRALAALAERTESALDGLDRGVTNADEKWQRLAPAAADGLEERETKHKLEAQLKLVGLALSRRPPSLPSGTDTDTSREADADGTGKQSSAPQQAGDVGRVFAVPQTVRAERSRSSDCLIRSAVELPPVQTVDAMIYFCRPLTETPTFIDATQAVAQPSSVNTVNLFEGGNRWCGEKELSEIVGPLLKGTPLWGLDLFVIDDSGRTVYARDKSGLRLARLRKSAPSSAGKKGDGAASDTEAATLPTLEEVSTSTIVRSIEIEGASYKLFSQPLRLNRGTAGPDQTWAVGTLVPTHALHGDTRRVPLVALGAVPLLVLLTVLALPILHVLSVGAREPLTIWAVIGVCLSLFVGTGLAVILAFDGYAYWRFGERVDEELFELADAIQESFQSEAEAALTVLEAFEQRNIRPDGLRGDSGEEHICESVLGDARCKSRRLLGRFTDAEHPPTEFRLDVSDIAAAFEKYPAFEMLVRTNASGLQIEKWTTSQTATPIFDMRDDNAFRDAIDGRLLAFGARTAMLTVMSSPNTGEVKTVLSMPNDDPANPGIDGVAMILPELLSVVDPVVLPGTGFAIIDNTGRVLFHSNAGLRLYENFFAEAAGEERLRSAVFARRHGYHDLDYHGTSQRLYVQPLRPTPWSLLVFRAKDGPRTLNLEVVLSALLCFLGLVPVYAAWAMAAGWLLGVRLRAIAWPDPNAVLRYVLLGAALAGLATSLSWSLLHNHGWPALLAITSTSLTAIGLVIVGLGFGRSDRPGRWIVAFAIELGLLAMGGSLALEAAGPLAASAWLAAVAALLIIIGAWEPNWLARPVRTGVSFTAAYVSMATLLLVIIAALPAAAIFRDAFDLGSEAFGRAGQIKLADSLVSHRLSMRRKAKRVPHGSDGTTSQFSLEDFWNSRDWEEPALATLLSIAKTDDSGSRPTPADPGNMPLHQWLSASCVADDDDAYASADYCRMLDRNFTGPLLHALPVYGEDATAHRHTVFSAASDGSWSDETGTLDVTPLFVAELPMIPPMRPVLRWPATISGWLLAGSLALFGLAALSRLLLWLLQRVYSLDLWETGAILGGIEPIQGRYYLRPGSLELDRIERRVLAAEGQIIDIAKLSRPRDLEQAIMHVFRGSVLLRSFERGIDQPEWNRAKLALLEELLGRGLHVDVVTETDILPYFGRRLNSDADPADSTYLTEIESGCWARALSRLEKRRSDLPDAPAPPRQGESETLRAECRATSRLRAIEREIRADARWTALSHDALVRHVGDLADAHYRSIWHSLTDEERLELYHIAKHGFANPKKRDLICQLMKRGLVRRDPTLRLMNESFERFATRVEDRATYRSWERAAGISAWTWVRNGVMATAVLAGVFLFLTQPEAYAKWVGLLAALTTVGGAMSQVLGLFQGRRPASPS